MLSKITKDTIPNTPEEAIQVLDVILSNENKEFLRTEEEADIIVHFSLGLWIRNQWGLWRDSPLSKYFFDHGIEHPDGMSHEIIKAYIRHLKHEE